MRYRVKTGRPVEHKQAAEIDVVYFNLRETEPGYALAARFDPPENGDLTLMTHALDLFLGTLALRGWRHDQQEVRLASARDWPEPWWDGPAPDKALVVETDLEPDPGADANDLNEVCALVEVTWAVEHEFHRREAPIPDLQMGLTANGLALASIHPEPLGAAMREGRANIEERMRALEESVRSPTHAHVLLHLEGTPLVPWALADRPCCWGSQTRDAEGFARVFIALKDTSPDPRPETARTAVRLMLASGTDD